MTPVSGSSGPGDPTPAAATSCRPSRASASASSTHSTMAPRIASPPSRAGVGLLARPRIAPSPPTTPARTFVPPRSMPRTGGPHPCPIMLARSEVRPPPPLRRSPGGCESYPIDPSSESRGPATAACLWPPASWALKIQGRSRTPGDFTTKARRAQRQTQRKSCSVEDLSVRGPGGWGLVFETPGLGRNPGVSKTRPQPPNTTPARVSTEPRKSQSGTARWITWIVLSSLCLSLCPSCLRGEVFGIPSRSAPR